MESRSNDFFFIPEEFRCNPFDISPSGDIFFADKRNIDKVKKGIESVKEANNVILKSKDDITTFLNDL